MIVMVNVLLVIKVMVNKMLVIMIEINYDCSQCIPTSGSSG